MKYLSYYKKLYRKAKTDKGRKSAMSNAMFNLYSDDREKFIKWLINPINKYNGTN